MAFLKWKGSWWTVTFTLGAVVPVVMVLIWFIGGKWAGDEHPKETFASADRVIVFKIIEPKDLNVARTEIKEKTWISTFLESVEVTEDTGKRCDCAGEYRLVFFAGEKRLGILSLHHRERIRVRQLRLKGDGKLSENSVESLYGALGDLPAANWVKTEQIPY